MGKRASKRVVAVSAVAAAIAALGAAPAQASSTAECGPAIKPICDAVGRQVDHAKAEAEAASDYALYWGDIVIREANNAYWTVRCYVLEECT